MYINGSCMDDVFVALGGGEGKATLISVYVPHSLFLGKL